MSSHRMPPCWSMYMHAGEALGSEQDELELAEAATGSGNKPTLVSRSIILATERCNTRHNRSSHEQIVHHQDRTRARERERERERERLPSGTRRE